MGQPIQFRRGNEVNLPSLQNGEPAVTSDTGKLFYGTPQGNVEVARQEDLDTANTQLTLLIPITSISSTPSFIGQLAVVDGIGYMAVGTSGASDWKQITNEPVI